jgi:hypothetical protein
MFTFSPEREFLMKRIFGLVVVLLLLGACNKTLPIYNVENAPVLSTSGDAISMDQVQKAIVQAVVSKTWRVTNVDDGKIEANFIKQKKSVDIIIKYDLDNYSILYEGSVNLLYKNGSIHRRYNSWIRGLQIRIDENLARLKGNSSSNHSSSSSSTSLEAKLKELKVLLDEGLITAEEAELKRAELLDAM